jgi:hypothetical protein
MSAAEGSQVVLERILAERVQSLALESLMPIVLAAEGHVRLRSSPQRSGRKELQVVAVQENIRHEQVPPGRHAIP